MNGVISRSKWPTRDLWAAELSIQDDSEKGEGGRLN